MANYSIIPVSCGDGSTSYGVKCDRTGACVFYGLGESDHEIIENCERQAAYLNKTMTTNTLKAAHLQSSQVIKPLKESHEH